MTLRLVSSGDDSALAIRDHLVPLVRLSGSQEVQRDSVRLISEFENELPSGTLHGVEYMSAVATWCGFVSDGDAAHPMDGILARAQ
jgi:hypothetical protein